MKHRLPNIKPFELIITCEFIHPSHFWNNYLKKIKNKVNLLVKQDFYLCGKANVPQKDHKQHFQGPGPST